MRGHIEITDQKVWGEAFIELRQRFKATVRKAPLINEEAVATMEAVGSRSGRDVLGKVWKLFLGQGPDAVFKLETLGAGSDPAALAQQAHFLKSMCLSSGAARRASVCEEVELAGKAGNMAGACAGLASVRPLLEQTCAAMSAQLSTHPAAAAR